MPVLHHVVHLQYYWQALACVVSRQSRAQDWLWTISQECTTRLIGLSLTARVGTILGGALEGGMLAHVHRTCVAMWVVLQGSGRAWQPAGVWAEVSVALCGWAQPSRVLAHPQPLLHTWVMSRVPELLRRPGVELGRHYQVTGPAPGVADPCVLEVVSVVAMDLPRHPVQNQSCHKSAQAPLAEPSMPIGSYRISLGQGNIRLTSCLHCHWLLICVQHCMRHSLYMWHLNPISALARDPCLNVRCVAKLVPFWILFFVECAWQCVVDGTVYVH
jgi:hypothetical protein